MIIKTSYQNHLIFKLKKDLKNFRKLKKILKESSNNIYNLKKNIPQLCLTSINVNVNFYLKAGDIKINVATVLKE